MEEREFGGWRREDVKSDLGEWENELTRENYSTAIQYLGTVAWFCVFFQPSLTVHPQAQRVQTVGFNEGWGLPVNMIMGEKNSRIKSVQRVMIIIMTMGSKLDKERFKYIRRLMEKAIVNALEISAGSRMENSVVLIPLSAMVLIFL